MPDHEKVPFLGVFAVVHGVQVTMGVTGARWPLSRFPFKFPCAMHKKYPKHVFSWLKFCSPKQVQTVEFAMFFVFAITVDEFLF